MPPMEFSPEITDEFMNKLTRPIQDRTAQRVGQARGEALERGLSGDAWEASAVGLAKGEGDRQETDVRADAAFQLAGLSRQERLGKEARGYDVEDRNFAANERATDRALQERLARLGYDFQQSQSDTDFRRSYQMLPWQIGAQGAGLAFGKKLGGIL